MLKFLIIFIIGFGISFIVHNAKFINSSNNFHDIIKCNNISQYVPRNVHELHINNIDVIIALGDSITAGYGINGLIGLNNEYRGKSWSIGGDENQMTLPNIIKYFNPKLKGYSLNHHKAEICYLDFCISKYIPKFDKYNSAQSGSTTENLFHQISYLKKQINIDDIKKWKMITILIGANDLCGICHNKIFNPKNFENNLRNALYELKENFPNSFVNLALIFNVSNIYEITQKSFYCRNFHRLFSIECSCAFDLINGEKNRKIMEYYTKIYQKITWEVAYEVNTAKFDNFTVVLQPMLAMTNTEKLTTDFLSTLDCFHPSLEAHQAMAISLWNNLFLHPLKKEPLEQYPIFKCPKNNSILQSNFKVSYGNKS